MRRRTFLASALGMGCLPQRIAAQGAPTPARIGWLTAQRAPSLAPYLDALRSGLPNSATRKDAISSSNIGMATTTSRVCLNLRWAGAAPGCSHRCAGRSRFGRSADEPGSPHRICDQR